MAPAGEYSRGNARTGQMAPSLAREGQGIYARAQARVDKRAPISENAGLEPDRQRKIYRVGPYLPPSKNIYIYIY